MKTVSSLPVYLLEPKLSVAMSVFEDSVFSLRVLHLTSCHPDSLEEEQYHKAIRLPCFC